MRRLFPSLHGYQEGWLGDVGRVRDVLHRTGDVSVPAYRDVEAAIAALERGEHR